MNNLCLQSIDLGPTEIKLLAPNLNSSPAIKERTLFWSKIWPASIALSKFLLEHAPIITHKKVLELGAGLGLPSITASAFAQQIYCSDAAEEAMNIVAASVAYNNITNISCSVYGWQQFAAFPSVDVLLLSDVAYNPLDFDLLYSVVMHFLASKTTVIISTPQRLTARTFMEKLMPYCILQKEFIIEEKSAAVYTTVFLLRSGSSTGGVGSNSIFT